jgi:hypothetical protein
MRTKRHPTDTQRQPREGAALAHPALPRTVVRLEQLQFVLRCCARQPWAKPLVLAGVLGGSFSVVAR